MCTKVRSSRTVKVKPAIDGWACSQGLEVPALTIVLKICNPSDRAIVSREIGQGALDPILSYENFKEAGNAF